VFSKLIDFILDSEPHYKSKGREVIAEIIKKHIKYNTCDFEIDNNGEFIFVCRWNIEGNKAVVLDLIINKKYKGIKTIKWILAKNWIKHPDLKEIEWEREIKYPHRKRKSHLIKEVL
jgi:hypothetical protein